MALNPPGTVPISLPDLSTTPVFSTTERDDDDTTTFAPSATQVDIPLPSPSITQVPSSASSVSASASSSVRSVPSASSTLSTMSTPAPSQPEANDPNTASSKSGPNLGLILGLVFGILGLLALALFLVRFMYIRRRHQHQQSGQRLAYSKAKYTISAPTNFTVVESGTLGADGKSIAASLSRPETSMSIQPSTEDWGNGGSGERAGSPERMRERYPFEAMSSLESGLKNQMQTMKTAQLGARKPVPVITVEVDSR